MWNDSFRKNRPKTSFLVSDEYVHDGSQNSAPPPPPPAPVLKPVGSRSIKQKPIVKEMSLNDQLMAQIRQASTVSDDYVFDGSNVEKRQEVSQGCRLLNNVQTNATIKSSIGSKPKPQPVANLEGRDLLLSEIQNGIKLRSVPN